MVNKKNSFQLQSQYQGPHNIAPYGTLPPLVFLHDWLDLPSVSSSSAPLDHITIVGAF